MVSRLKFIVNGIAVRLCLQEGQDELVQKLTFDDPFTISYLQDLKSKKLIDVKGDFHEVRRLVDGRDEQLQIYNVPTSNDEDGIELFIGLGDQETNQINDTEATCGTSLEPNQKIDIWTDDETQYLLDRFELYLPSLVGPCKRFKTKKQLWQQIADDLENHLNITRTYVQVENRYKTIMKRTKKPIDNNHRPGHERMQVPFEAETAKITAVDVSIEPDVLQSSNRKRKICCENSDDGSRKTAMEVERLLNSIKEQREKHHRQREAAREKRHREKMTLLKAVLQLGKLPPP